jgi:hypothetical protein
MEKFKDFVDNFIHLLLGLSIGLLIGFIFGIHGICIEKDKIITILKQTNVGQVQVEVPKSLPVINVK